MATTRQPSIGESLENEDRDLYMSFYVWGKYKSNPGLKNLTPEAAIIYHLSIATLAKQLDEKDMFKPGAIKNATPEMIQTGLKLQKALDRENFELKSVLDLSSVSGILNKAQSLEFPNFSADEVEELSTYTLNDTSAENDSITTSAELLSRIASSISEENTLKISKEKLMKLVKILDFIHEVKKFYLVEIPTLATKLGIENPTEDLVKPALAKIILNLNLDAESLKSLENIFSHLQSYIQNLFPALQGEEAYSLSAMEGSMYFGTTEESKMFYIPDFDEQRLIAAISATPYREHKPQLDYPVVVDEIYSKLDQLNAATLSEKNAAIVSNLKDACEFYKKQIANEAMQLLQPTDDLYLEYATRINYGSRDPLFGEAREADDLIATKSSNPFLDIFNDYFYSKEQAIAKANTRKEELKNNLTNNLLETEENTKRLIAEKKTEIESLSEEDEDLIPAKNKELREIYIEKDQKISRINATYTGQVEKLDKELQISVSKQEKAKEKIESYCQSHPEFSRKLEEYRAIRVTEMPLESKGQTNVEKIKSFSTAFKENKSSFNDSFVKKIQQILSKLTRGIFFSDLWQKPTAKTQFKESIKQVLDTANEKPKPR